jgi:hypothetical protein
MHQVISSGKPGLSPPRNSLQAAEAPRRRRVPAGGRVRVAPKDSHGAARIEIGDDGVCVEGLVGDQGAKGDTVNEWRNANRVEAMSWQQLKAHEVAQGIGQRQNLSRHAAFGTADGLTRSPPFAPCPWRWTLTMVASTMAYSMSGSSETAFEQPAPVRLPGPEILPV